MKTIVVPFLSSLVLILWGMEVKADPLFIVDMCVWICMMISAYSRIERKFLQFAFGLTFFTFLMGREFLEQYSLYSVEKTFLPGANSHLTINLLIGLLSFWASFTYFNHNRTIGEKTPISLSAYEATVRRYASLFKSNKI